MSQNRQKAKRAPKGFEVISDKLNEFKRKMREAESETLEFKRKEELLWPILRLTHQRSRYIWQMLVKNAISREVYEFCVKEKLVDVQLVSKWKKPGYEHLCCLQCADRNTNFGSTCLCRVPQNELHAQGLFECKTCGCRGCSGVKKEKQEPKQNATTEENTNEGTNDVKNNPNETDVGVITGDMPALADLL